MQDRPRPGFPAVLSISGVAFLLWLAVMLPAEAQGTGCREVSIAEIQGAGNSSPFEGSSTELCTTGCVSGVSAEGFFIQSMAPDTNPDTSEGIFVFRYTSWKNPRRLKAGDRVHLSGFHVQEYYGQTEAVKLADDKRASYQVLGTCALPDPVGVPVLGDPRLDPVELYERYEGMRVAMALDATVSGPTERYVSRFPAGEPEITLVDRTSPFFGLRLMASDAPSDRGSIALAGGLGVDLPDVGTFDRVSAEGVTGILAFQFGRYVLLVDDRSPLHVEDAADPVSRGAPVGPDEFALCTFNVENLFDQIDDRDGDVGDWSPANATAYLASVMKRAKAIRESLAGCAVVGLQEVEGKDAVWEALAQAVGETFRYDYFESQDLRDLTGGILYDSRRAELWHSESAQACTARDYGVDTAAARGPRIAPNPCTAGKFPLFDRAPYVGDLAVRNAAGDRTLDVRVVVSHLKSKRGDEAENEPRRVLQARYLATLLNAPFSVALGDLNDTLDSAALRQFGGLVNLHERHVGPRNRFSYIYQGRAEAVDHIIMTSHLDRHFLRGGPVHINADYPEKRTPDNTVNRSSDHDPVMAIFAFQPSGVTDALFGALTGALSIP